MDLLVKQASDSEDRIPVMVSERLSIYPGLSWDSILRSTDSSVPITVMKKNKPAGAFVFAREVNLLGEDESLCRLIRSFLDGYICKPPVYRKTPLGREIADLLLAVNRPYGKSDYIPCICWGRNARYASALKWRSCTDLGQDPEQGIHEADR